MSKLTSLRKIKANFDWDYYVNSHFTVKRSESKNGVELRICCPSCLENKYKCYVNPKLRVFNCFRCGFKVGDFDVFDFVALTEGINRSSAIARLLIEHVDLTPEELDFKSYLEGSHSAEFLESSIKYIPSLPKECQKLTPIEGNIYWEYVKDRGFVPDDLLTTQAHYISKEMVPIYNTSGKYKGNIGQRLVFPVYGEQGQYVSYLARSVIGAQPKYLNCPESDLSKTFWPYSKPYTSEVVIVEGIIDALSIRRVPGCSAYATFGKSMSKEQIVILKNWGVNSVIVWYDRKDAKSQIIDLVDTLHLHFNKVFVLDLKEWPKEQDAGDLLKHSNGADIIKSFLDKKVDTDDIWEYSKWKMIF